MFDIGVGFEKLLLIGIVALVVVGPEDLPRVLYTLGTWVRKVRALAAEFQTGISGLMAEEEIRQLKEELSRVRETATSPLPPSSAGDSLPLPEGQSTPKPEGVSPPAPSSLP